MEILYKLDPCYGITFRKDFGSLNLLCETLHRSDIDTSSESSIFGFSSPQIHF